MCPWPSSLELCIMIALVRTLRAILHSPTFFGDPWMSLPSAVHVSSTFEFGAMRRDCLVQFSILNLFRSPMNCVFVHVSSSFEFGVMRSDCLVHFSILIFFYSNNIIFSFIRPLHSFHSIHPFNLLFWSIFVIICSISCFSVSVFSSFILQVVPTKNIS